MGDFYPVSTPFLLAPRGRSLVPGVQTASPIERRALLCLKTRNKAQIMYSTGGCTPQWSTSPSGVQRARGSVDFGAFVFRCGKQAVSRGVSWRVLRSFLGCPWGVLRTRLGVSLIRGTTFREALSHLAKFLMQHALFGLTAFHEADYSLLHETQLPTVVVGR